MAQRSQNTATFDRINCSSQQNSETKFISDKVRRQRTIDHINGRQSRSSWFSSSMMLALSVLLVGVTNVKCQQITTEYLNLSAHRRLDIVDQAKDQELDDESNVILKGAVQNDFESGSADDNKGKIGAGSNLGAKVKNEWEMKNLRQRYAEGEDRLYIQSLYPRGGPTSGGTRVQVRAEGLEDLVDIFPEPKCRFGKNDMIVAANWIKCAKKPLHFYGLERQVPKDNVCVLCDDSPSYKVDPEHEHAKGDMIITLSVSLSGDFTDVYSSLPYRYYPQAEIHRIVPTHGPKDGDTLVQAWGKNFLDLGDDFRCNFGTRSTQAYAPYPTYLYCRSAFSDIVDVAQPFSVSLNRQQNTIQDIAYYYYSDPNLDKLDPPYAKLGGGDLITLVGSGFDPFHNVMIPECKGNPNYNGPEFCITSYTYCKFGALGTVHAEVVSSTRAKCKTKPNNFNPPLVSVMVQLTLNNQNYTEGVEMLFFNPPGIVEITPAKSPTTGGWKQHIYGNKFSHVRDPICIYGGVIATVPTVFVSQNQIICTAPPYYRPGWVELIVKYRNDRFHAGSRPFLYFETPQVDSLEPGCGPVKGYTQIYVTGINFNENNGFGQSQCRFNDSYTTNATVIDVNSLYCDSPILDLGDSDTGDYFYNFSVSVDGGESWSLSNNTFYYYDDADIKQISPINGPFNEANTVNIMGKNLNHPNMCNKTVKFGQIEFPISSSSDSNIVVNTKAVNVPGSVVVAVSGNGQQYNDDITLHFRDRSNTFEFYQPFIVEAIVPYQATAGGHTDIHIIGMLFDQFKNHNGSSKIVDYKCRFMTSAGEQIGEEKNMTRVSDIEYICTTPPSKYTGDTRIEVCQNEVNWQYIERPLILYNGPKVTSVDPTFGVTKNPNKSTLIVKGDNFACPGDCNHIWVRFTNKDGDRILTKGHMEGSEVHCTYPEYPSPESLDVDISFNGLDWSNDKVKFSYVDPFVLGVKPRLVSPKGTTKLHIIGYGMGNTTAANQQIGYLHYPDNKRMTHGGHDAMKEYKVHSENLIEVGTFPMAELEYNGKSVEYDPWIISIINPDKDFDPNDVYLYYYSEPDVRKQSAEFAYVNEEKVILFEVDFKWGQNHADVFRDHGNFTCRFTSEKNGTYIKFTDAFMETSPIGSMKHGQFPDQIRCRTPTWDFAGDVAKLDVSFNGHDYYGGYQMNMVDALSTLRISPLCGPIDGGTKVNIYGTGMNSSVPQEATVMVKFGTTHQQSVDKSNIEEITFSDDDYHDELHLSDKLLKIAETNYPDIDDKQLVEKYSGAITPNISDRFNFEYPDIRGAGGVVSVLIGENVNISMTDHDKNSSTFKQKIDTFIECAYYDTSDLEFYFYRQPWVKSVEPLSGLNQGGTVVDIEGAWFAENAMYGQFPFCKFGDVVVRGRFLWTTKIQCTSPQTEVSNEVKISVSLNAVDWVDTGHDFGYYEKPILNDIRPRYGNTAGGTVIYLKGSKFSKATNKMSKVQCRFTQMNPAGKSDEEDGLQEDDDYNPLIKTMPAVYIDQETMRCASPAGFGGGDRVLVDLTFNGVDYTDNKFEFNYYAFYGSFPKSAPYDATNQFIQVRGKGFTNDMAILCLLNGQEMAPLSVHYNLIKCPMIVDKDNRRRLKSEKENKSKHGFGENDFGSVPFAIKLEGVKQSFGNFHYYRQCIIDDVTPLIAPNDGKGAIYVIGRGFRDDFENSKLGCRIGNTLAQAQLLDTNTIRCTVNNELALIEEGESLLVTVALNTYSWAASDFSMSPYGITAMYPNMGPIGQSTNILVMGKGFDNDLRELGRCKFGTEEHYLIIEANVLDNDHLICKSPSDAFTLPEGASEQISVPFSIAFQEDLYYPWTQSGEKYRMYKQPRLSDASPREAKVGRLSEIFVTAKEDEPFFLPAPPPTGEQFEQYNIKCKFGRFGSSPATYLNKTTVLCLTPNIKESPSEISTEVVELTIAMNGVDFNDDYSDITVTFVGTGQGMSIAVIIMGTLIFALLIISIIVFLFGLQTLIAAQNTKSELDNNEGEGRAGGAEGGQNSQPASGNSKANQRSDRGAGGAGGRLSRDNGGSRNQGSRGLGNRATGSRNPE